MSSLSFFSLLFFFFNDTATTEIYTLSLHDALPISDIWTLAMLRFVTGLGLGAAMPNAVTLMSEYCPDTRRATLTNTMFCGFPLGAAFGGFVAAWIIPQYGWRSVLLLGGIAPLVLTLLLILFMPESIRYMVSSKYPVVRIRGHYSI